MLENYGDVLEIPDLMKILKLGRNSVYDLLNKGVIKCRKYGRKFIIPKICVIDYLKSTRYTD